MALLKGCAGQSPALPPCVGTAAILGYPRAAPLSAIHEAAAVDAGQDGVDPSRGPAGVSGGSGFRARRGAGACREMHAAPRKRESHDSAEVPTLALSGPIGATF